MKALLITAIASFFALSASAQTTTGTTATQPATKLSTGSKSDVQRPLRVANSDTPPAKIQSRKDAQQGVAQPTGDINKVDTKASTVDKKAPVSTLTEGPASGTGIKATNSPNTSTGSKDAPATRSEAPKQ